MTPSDGKALAARVAGLIAAIGGYGGREPAPASRADPRVAAAVEHLRQARGTRVSLTELAREASLSPGRLACLFRVETELPVRRYALWLGLQRAAACLAGDAGPGTGLLAAHEAGFADAAHMTRTFKRMFGVIPSAVAVRRGAAAERRARGRGWQRPSRGPQSIRSSVPAGGGSTRNRRRDATCRPRVVFR